MTRNSIAVQNAKIRLQQIDLENQGASTDGAFSKYSKFRKGSIVKVQKLCVKTDLVRDIYGNVLYNSDKPIYQQNEPGKKDKEPKVKGNKDNIKETKEVKEIDKSKEKDYLCLICKENTHRFFSRM